MQNLYRITVMTPTENVDRGVWAEDFAIDPNSNSIVFVGSVEDPDRVVGVYPAGSTFISSVQSYEEYKNSKKNVLGNLK